MIQVYIIDARFNISFILCFCKIVKDTILITNILIT